MSEDLISQPAATDAASLDSYHAHEALHTSLIVAEMFERYLAEHPYVQAHPALKAEAERLVAGLHGFYQRIGALAL